MTHFLYHTTCDAKIVFESHPMSYKVKNIIWRLYEGWSNKWIRVTYETNFICLQSWNHKIHDFEKAFTDLPWHLMTFKHRFNVYAAFNDRKTVWKKYRLTCFELKLKIVITILDQWKLYKMAIFSQFLIDFCEDWCNHGYWPTIILRKYSIQSTCCILTFVVLS